jgi:hypothetical protein
MYLTILLLSSSVATLVSSFCNSIHHVAVTLKLGQNSATKVMGAFKFSFGLKPGNNTSNYCHAFKGVAIKERGVGFSPRRT